MTEDWHEVTEDLLKPYHNSEFSRAVAYFCAFVPVNYITSNRERLQRILFNICAFLMVIFFMCAITAILWSGAYIHYTFMVIPCCLVLGLPGRNFVNGCTIGHGLALVIAFGLFFVAKSSTIFLSYANGSRHVIIGSISALCGYSFGASLALGIGAGVSISLSLLRCGQNDQLSSTFSPLALCIFTFAILIAILTESKPVQNLHNLVKWPIMPLVFILSVVLLQAFVHDVTFTVNYLAGFFFGLAFIAGQKHGRKFAWKVGLGHTNRVLTVVIGIVLGFLFGYFVLQWELPQKDYQLIYAFFGILFCVGNELYRYFVKVTDKLPADLISKMKRDNDKDWPAKLHLLDCKSETRLLYLLTLMSNYGISLCIHTSTLVIEFL